MNGIICKFGKLLQPKRAKNAFTAMQRLLDGVDEPVIFDVGAHHGSVSLLFRKLFPKATIYAFEPFQESFEHLKANTASDPKIHAFNFGLSDRDGEQSFHSNPSSATNSLLATHEQAAQTWGSGLLETQQTVQAQFKTIDSVLATMGIPKIDLLKLDVQGAEHLVIAGATASCKDGRIGLIYSEIITQPTYKSLKRFDEALASFYDKNFDLFDIYNLNNSPEGRLRQVDVIFTKKAKQQNG